MRDVVGDILWLGEEQQLEDARTHAPLVEVGGERYCRVEQERHPETIYHGLWGAHRIEEPLYRLAGMRKRADHQAAGVPTWHRGRVAAARPCGCGG